MKKLSGFSLVELMIVVAIIGVLAAIAVPNYNDYVLRGKITEAFSQLSSLQVRMEQYYQDNRSYQRAASSTVVSNGVSCATTCGILPPTTGIENFSYCCTISSSGQGFTYTATGTGSTAGFVYTVNDTGARGTTSLGAGWTGGTTCWVKSKGASC